ncbi:MAG: hypothetical protein IJP17_00015 [Clostridia bacterium]|nr:hypothetical protein [Clostridia bacterium]
MNDEKNIQSSGKTFNDFMESLKQKYSEHLIPTDKPVIEKKKTTQTVIIAVAALLILLTGIVMFLVMYPYHTTGVTVDEFIDRFNAMTVASDSEVWTLMPEYEDIKIPEDAKLGGKNVIKLFDDQVVISADVRFGKIVNLDVDAVNLKNYNPEVHFFNVDGTDYSFLKFFIVYGKVYSVFDFSDTRVNDSYVASLQAYGLHYYAQLNETYELPTVEKRDLENGDIINVVTYDLESLNMNISPSQKTIANDPVWPGNHLR